MVDRIVFVVFCPSFGPGVPSIGAHLDVGLEQRPSLCRHVGTIHDFLVLGEDGLVCQEYCIVKSFI